MRATWVGLLGSAVLAGALVHPAASASRAPEAAGSYQLAEVRNVQVRSHDGTVLDGWIASPTVPKGTRTPVVLTVSPYFDSQYLAEVDRNPATPPEPDCELTGQGCGFWHDGPMSAPTRTHSMGFPPIHLIQRGYTLAYFSVRGTGSSGGCFDMGGREEQRDQVVLVDWLAKQPWSNGRVGMAGLSYMSYTAWQAAVQAPPALKTIVTAGDVSDLYQLFFSPQGSRSTYDDAALSEYETERGVTGGVLSARTQFLQHQACPRGTLMAQQASSLLSGDRNAAYWQERNISLRMPKVRAAVLDTTGYLDVGHQFQGDLVWGSLPRQTPKLQVRGWWAHEFPGSEETGTAKLSLPAGTVPWENVVVRWLDHWLKGVGPAPSKGLVYHQDQDRRWHEARSWPPSPSGKQALYLSGARLAPSAGSGSTSFVSAPGADTAWAQTALAVDGAGVGIESSLCQDPLGATLARVYETPPVSSRTLLAGNPFASLRLSSDRPGGLVTATLFDLAPDFSCTGAHFQGARWLSSGSADLGFHRSPFVARDFPVDRPVQVRLDLSDVTWSLAPGHRLALVLNHGSLAERYGAAQLPTITVDASSHLVVPVVTGTLGGKRPTLRYPQRPFTPRHYRD